MRKQPMYTIPGTESSSHPIWPPRIRMLYNIFSQPMTIVQLKELAFTTYKWAPNMVAQVLAAGEGRYFYYVTRTGNWTRLQVTFPTISKEKGIESEVGV